MTILLPALLAVVLGGSAVDAGGRPIRKPDLYIYTATWCEPCQTLKADLEHDRDFRAALVERYDVRIYDVERYKLNAQLAGVKSLPAFFAPGQRWEGYRGKVELAERLKLAWRPEPAPATAPLPAPPPSPTGDETRRALEAAYERWGAHERALRSIETAAASLAERVEQIERRPPLDLAPVRAELHAELKRRADQLAAERPGIVADLPSRGFDWLALLGTFGVALGWTGPPALAAIGVARILRSIGLRRRPQPVARPRPEAFPPETGVGAIELPEAVPIVTQFQPVQIDTYRDAHAWAVAELGRKEPGAVGTLVALDGLIAQRLSSKGAAHAVRK